MDYLFWSKLLHLVSILGVKTASTCSIFPWSGRIKRVVVFPWQSVHAPSRAVPVVKIPVVLGILWHHRHLDCGVLINIEVVGSGQGRDEWFLPQSWREEGKRVPGICGPISPSSIQETHPPNHHSRPLPYHPISSTPDLPGAWIWGFRKILK